MTLHVLNPNSNAAVTAGIDAAMEPLRGDIRIQCHTLAQGPRGIESQRDVDRVAALVPDWIAAHPGEGYVIACFSDPGLHGAREITRKPVIGIQEAGLLQALTLGHRFGIIAILPASVPRHLRVVGAMGLTDRLAGDLPLGLTVAELGDVDRTVSRMSEVGHALRARGADVLVMGCAGMARYRETIATETGLPVVEPCQAAAAMALGRIRLGW